MICIKSLSGAVTANILNKDLTCSDASVMSIKQHLSEAVTSVGKEDILIIRDGRSLVDEERIPFHGNNDKELYAIVKTTRNTPCIRLSYRKTNAANTKNAEVCFVDTKITCTIEDLKNTYSLENISINGLPISPDMSSGCVGDAILFAPHAQVNEISRFYIGNTTGPVHTIELTSEPFRNKRDACKLRKVSSSWNSVNRSKVKIMNNNRGCKTNTVMDTYKLSKELLSMSSSRRSFLSTNNQMKQYLSPVKA